MDSPPRGVVPATPELAHRLADRLADAHVREIWETGGLFPRDALALSLASSREAYAYAPRGEPLFMMGVEPRGLLTDGAVVWMLAADSAAARPAGLLRAARWGMARAFRVTGAFRLQQRIPDWYRTGLRFALRMGFALSPAEERGRNGGRLWNATAIRPRRDHVGTDEEKPWEHSIPL